LVDTQILDRPEPANLVQISVNEMNLCNVEYSTIPPISSSDDYGYKMTDAARIKLLSYTKEKEGYVCDYFLFTNGDNFYLPNFLPKVVPYMKEGKDMIAVHFWSHHMNQIISTAWKHRSIDLGSAVLSRKVVIQSAFTTYEGSWWPSDWAFFDQCLKLSNNNIIVPEYLFIV